MQGRAMIGCKISRTSLRAYIYCSMKLHVGSCVYEKALTTLIDFILLLYPFTQSYSTCFLPTARWPHNLELSKVM
jgi:hypothetical protein